MHIKMMALDFSNRYLSKQGSKKKIDYYKDL